MSHAGPPKAPPRRSGSKRAGAKSAPKPLCRRERKSLLRFLPRAMENRWALPLRSFSRMANKWARLARVSLRTNKRSAFSGALVSQNPERPEEFENEHRSAADANTWRVSVDGRVGFDRAGVRPGTR